MTPPFRYTTAAQQVVFGPGELANLGTYLAQGNRRALAVARDPVSTATALTVAERIATALPRLESYQGGIYKPLLAGPAGFTLASL